MFQRNLLLFVAVLLALLLLVIVFSVSDASAVNCTTMVSIIERPNKVGFVYLCTGISEGWQTVDFGDKVSTDVYFSQNMTATTWHEYGYIPGGVITYTSLLSVTKESEEYIFPTAVVINDKPYILIMPFITISKPAASCQISILSQDINHVTFSVSWLNAGNGSHTFYFGDGGFTQKFFGVSGIGEVWHNYPWLGGPFTVEMDLDGEGACNTNINIGFFR